MKAKVHYLPGKVCLVCNQAFTDLNVYSELGVKEIHISNICENCFDSIFDDGEQA